ncbi:MAG TPA: transcriptional repressor NrdR [Bacteroidetes bacterium]|nr:transcriptional repressor NrdR [Bacteroidota bacterium]
MRCPYCNYPNSKVLDSRNSNNGRAIRRRRECSECGRRFTTREFIEEEPLMVIKSDGRRELFNRDKIRSGVQLACKKRAVSTQDIEAIVDRIELKIRDDHACEIPTIEIGNMVMDALRELDEIAYVRFASVYRKFQDKQEFINELRGL